LELSKQAVPDFLKSFITELVPNLLETLSGYESSELNYMSLKLNSQDLQEKLDLARISTSKSSPMIEIINLTLPLIDTDLLNQLIPKLIEILRRGLGVSTKAGVCHIIISLIDMNPTLVAPYAGKLMAALVNSISNETNKTIRRTYCNTLGSIAKIAKESSIENLLKKLKEWYFDKDGMLKIQKNGKHPSINFYIQKTMESSCLAV
jgi:proteasome component ECM29